MNQAIAITKKPASDIQGKEMLDQVKAMVIDSVESPNTRQAYGKGISDFMSWYIGLAPEAEDRPVIDKRLVNSFRTRLINQGLASSTINLRLSAIRRLLEEAADNNLIPLVQAWGISKVKGVKSNGVRTGNWLTLDQAQELLSKPDNTMITGLRDRAILAILLGCGLRRSEVANLTFKHVQQREGRWAIVDLIGKRNKIRTVLMPSWAKAALDQWMAALVEELNGSEKKPLTGRIFRALNKGGKLAKVRKIKEGVMSDGRMSDQAIASVVLKYTQQCGFDDLAAHDLRRTFAKLAHKGGAAIEQISKNLGHESIKTTELYLGIDLDMTNAPCDYIALHLGG